MLYISALDLYMQRRPTCSAASAAAAAATAAALAASSRAAVRKIARTSACERGDGVWGEGGGYLFMPDVHDINYGS